MAWRKFLSPSTIKVASFRSKSTKSSSAGESIAAAKSNEENWLFPTPVGLEMLGLEPLSACPPTTRAWSSTDELAILFRSCTLVRVDHLIEFKLDPHRLRELTSYDLGELRDLLSEVELPSTVAAMLDDARRPADHESLVADNKGAIEAAEIMAETVPTPCVPVG